MTTGFHVLAIDAVGRDTRDAVTIAFGVPPDLAAAFAFQAGQHVTLRLNIGGEEARRSYSICVPPGAGALRIAVKRVEGGLVSNWLNDHAAVGGRLEVLPPSGHFRLPAGLPAGGHVVLFAAGSGITPLLSILAAALVDDPTIRFTLVYGNRTLSSTMQRQSLLDLKDRHMERLNLVFVMSREHQDIEVFNGRIDPARCRALLDGWLARERYDAALLCGPEAMVQALVPVLVERGVARDRIRFELFTPAAPRPGAVPVRAAGAGGDCTVTVIQDGRRRTVSMRQGGESVLDAALRQGIELPYSCKGGVCSTCRALVREGDVEMGAVYGLEDYEISRGFVLCCQARPRTPTLVLDFDQLE